MGLTATLDIPFEPGPRARCSGSTPAARPSRSPSSRCGASCSAAIPRARAPCRSLACLRGRRAAAAAADPRPGRRRSRSSSIRSAATSRRALIGVDRVGAVEEVTLRGVSPLVATAGPYAGAIVRGAELRLCLDAHALSEMVCAVGAMS